MTSTKPHLVRLDTQEIIPVDRKLTFGRHPDCEYVVTINNENAGISGRHASIEVDGEYAWIEDLGSTNGTWVRGARIERRTPLLPGERFLLDTLEFEYRAAAQTAAAAATPQYDKTVMAGRRGMDLPPVPVSIEDSAPRLAPVIRKPVPPMLASAASMRAALAAHESPARSRNTADRETAPVQVQSSRSMLVYLALGFLALAGAAITLLLSRS
ncbi:MAG: FHA domain-containing protein [Pseudomonadota bacterium]